MLPTIAKPLVPENADAITDTKYDSGDRVTSTTYRRGGINGTVLGVVHVDYDAKGRFVQAYRSAS
jgi:hypothetical protein